MSEGGWNAARVTLLYFHSCRRGGGTISPLYQPPLSLAGHATEIRHFADSKTDVNGSSSCGVGERDRGKMRYDEDLRDFAKSSVCDHTANCPSQRRRKACDFVFLSLSKKTWVWRLNRKLSQYRVPSIFLFRPTFITLSVSQLCWTGRGVEGEI